METLVGMLLLAVLGMAIGKATITLISSREHSVRSNVAKQIAINTVEELKSRDPETLSDADDIDANASATKKYITRYNVRYTRFVDVTENSDGSRTIDVRVHGPTSRLGGNAHLSVTVVPWRSS